MKRSLQPQKVNYRLSKQSDNFSYLLQVYFLIGYTEEMLSQWLKCPVKLELQVVEDPKDVIYKYI